MNTKFIAIKKLEHWTQLTLNRPEVKNAFHPEMILEITNAFNELSKDSKTNVIVVRGEGSAFCAGADIGWMKKMIQFTALENKHDSEKLWDMFEAIRTCTKPVITIVHGAVFGGALGIVAASDYVYADAKTNFCFSEVKLGLAPAVISSFILKKVAFGFAHSKMIFGSVFNADMALAAGLVTEIISGIPSDEQVANLVKSNGPQAMIETKKMLLDLNFDSDWSRKRDTTTSLIAGLRVGAEAQDRLSKFLGQK